MAILLITHDLGIVEKFAHKVCVMNAGEIVEAGPCQQVFSAPQHDYTQHLLGAAPTGRAHDSKDDAPVLLSVDDLKVHFPITGGFFGRTLDHIKSDAIHRLDVV